MGAMTLSITVLIATISTLHAECRIFIVMLSVVTLSVVASLNNI